MGTPVERNHASLVNHLVKNHDVSGNLYDLIRVIVASGEYSAGHAPRDAPVPQTHVFVRVGAAGKVIVSFRLRLRSYRHPAIRRIHDHRSPSPLDDFRSAVEPELVIGA